MTSLPHGAVPSTFLPVVQTETLKLGGRPQGHRAEGQQPGLGPRLLARLSPWCPGPTQVSHTRQRLCSYYGHFNAVRLSHRRCAEPRAAEARAGSLGATVCDHEQLFHVSAPPRPRGEAESTHAVSVVTLRMQDGQGPGPVAKTQGRGQTQTPDGKEQPSELQILGLPWGSGEQQQAQVFGAFQGVEHSKTKATRTEMSLQVPQSDPSLTSQATVHPHGIPNARGRRGHSRAGPPLLQITQGSLSVRSMLLPGERLSVPTCHASLSDHPPTLRPGSRPRRLPRPSREAGLLQAQLREEAQLSGRGAQPGWGALQGTRVLSSPGRVSAPRVWMNKE